MGKDNYFGLKNVRHGMDILNKKTGNLNVFQVPCCEKI